ncbi:hypothetical protein G8E10_24955 [Rhizobiaceae bacterium CRRU44]|uniref:Uncharacterized protein n=1 Tax=Ferranicluibacter rubi TaxID=2715133 RepID=A0AA43ZL64_9HYPH|nr:hypothetical protein [Ferranicluibacter rubi]NHT78953.1 hypothetical protein [Ferranicluibacter rubi]
MLEDHTARACRLLPMIADELADFIPKIVLHTTRDTDDKAFVGLVLTALATRSLLSYEWQEQGRAEAVKRGFIYHAGRHYYVSPA